MLLLKTRLTIFNAMELACLSNDEVQVFIHALKIAVNYTAISQHNSDRLP